MSEEYHKVEMLRSVKGKDMLLVGEYLYHYDDRTSKAYRWVCSRRKDRTPCRVRMYTSLIDEWDLTRHKVENIIGEHPHGPAEEDAILRAREKKRQADAEGLPCTLSNKSLKRRIQKQESDKQSPKKIKWTDDSDEDENSAFRVKGDTSDEELGDLVESLGIKPPKKPKEKKLLMLKTAKGHHMVAVDGCVYRLDGKSMISTTYRWKCFRSKDLQCSGKIYTECLASGQHRFKSIRLEENAHNHQPYSEAKIEALIRRNNIKVLQGKEEKSSLKVFENLPANTDKIKTAKKTKAASTPLSATKAGGGSVLSISGNINLTPRLDIRRIRNETTAKLYRQVEDVMDALENPKDGEITKFTFLPSLKGNRILIMENMIFHYDSRGSHSDRAYWTCLYRRDKVHKCNSRLTTEGTGNDMKIIKVSGEHKHKVNHREHILKRINQNLKVKDNSSQSRKKEMYSETEEDDSDDSDDMNDQDDTQNNAFNDAGFSRGSTPDISDFLKLKPKSERDAETSHEAIETTLHENAQAPLTEYKTEIEVDPFHETLPVIEYIEMEQINESTYRSDSDAEPEYKPRATKSRGRKSTQNDADDEDDEDYVPSTKGRKPQTLLKKYSSSTPMASFNPDNIDTTKVTKLRSAKGGELLCVDGYIYHLKSISVTTRTYWTCIKSKDRILKCPARVTTIANADNELHVVHLSNSHTHPISENDIKKRLFNEFAKSSAKSDLRTKDIMDKSLSELNPEFAHLLGNHKTKRENIKFNMKLYSVSDGPPSLAVRMCLKALNIPYELHNVDYIASEHLSEEYSKINPQKEIPVLDDDGFLLSESIAIMQYLCDRYGDDKTSLYPKIAKDRALVNHRLCFNMSFYYANIGAYSMAPIFFDYERTEMGLKKVNNSLSVFETYLERLGTKYAAGNNVTLADFALVSATLCLEAISFDFSDYPRITKWYNTFKKEQPDLWSIASAGMEEIKEFENNPPDLSHMNHPFHPTRKHFV